MLQVVGLRSPGARRYEQLGYHRGVELYFDFISPYAYLAWKALRRLGEAPVARPVLFAALLEHSGQLGPAEIPAKRAWLIRDVMRQALKAELPMAFPATHPFRPLVALRVSHVDVAGVDQARVIDALFDHGWGRGGELGSEEGVRKGLETAGLDAGALLARASEPASKQALRRETERAIDQGAFGVPTFIVDGELFWGADRLEDALAHRRGELRLDPERVARALGAPFGVERARNGRAQRE